MKKSKNFILRRKVYIKKKKVLRITFATCLIHEPFINNLPQREEEKNRLRIMNNSLPLRVNFSCFTLSLVVREKSWVEFML